MTQENLKLVSTRLDPETLRKIDLFLQKYEYWKRNSVINGILTAVMDCFTDQQIYDMVRYWRKGQDETKAEFEIIEKKI